MSSQEFTLHVPQRKISSMKPRVSISKSATKTAKDLFDDVLIKTNSNMSKIEEEKGGDQDKISKPVTKCSISLLSNYIIYIVFLTLTGF